MTAMKTPTPGILPSRYQRIRYRFLFPSLIQGWLRSLCWLAIYFYALFFFLFALKEKADNPGYFLISSLFVLVVGAYGSMRLASRIITLGAELREYHRFSINRLWPMAFRAFGFSILLVLVVAPLICYGMTTLSNLPLRSSWLLPINILLLHMMLAGIAVFTTLAPNQGRRARILYFVVCPYQILGGPFITAAFWLVVIIGNILRAVWRSWQEFVTLWLDQLAGLADALLQIPAMGPIVMFWLNPYFLLIRLHTEQTYSPAAPVAFSAVCLIIIGVICIRVRAWLSNESEANSAKIYDNWLGFRAAIPFEEMTNAASALATVERSVPETAPSSTDEAIVSDSTITSRQTGVETLVSHNKHAVPSDFTLPKSDSAEYYLTSLNSGRSIWPHRWIIVAMFAIVAFAVLGPGKYKGVIFTLPILYAMATSTNVWKSTQAASTTPQSFRKFLLLRFKRQIKRIFLDLLVAFFIPLVYTNLFPNAIVTFLFIVNLRLILLAIKISYDYQLIISTTLGVLGLLLVGLAGIGGMTAVETEAMKPSDSIMNLTVLTAPVFLVWAWLLLVIKRKYNGLMHLEIIRPSGQM